MSRKITIEQIEEKRKVLTQTIKVSEEEIRKLELDFLKQEYNLVPNNVCRFGKEYGVLNSVHQVYSDNIHLKLLRITKDGKVSSNSRYSYAKAVEKVAENYEEFVKLGLVNNSQLG